MPTESTTAAKTIDLLRDKFAAFGIPLDLVSDNEPQFAILEERQSQQRKSHDSPRMKELSIEQGEKVAIWNRQRGSEKWMHETVIKAKGPRNYVIHTPDRNRMVHADDIVTAGGPDSLSINEYQYS